ncbi:MAG: putative transferase [Rhizobacter sp.]|nr:putative transferase [Rhizobacter sp.]
MSGYFSQLNYSLGDEDSRLELSVMPAGLPHAVTIAGSGGRVLPLLARSPRQLTCVDMSVAQLAMTSLRLACLERFDRDTYLRFMGYRPMSPAERESRFYDISLAEVERRVLKRVMTRESFGPVIYTGRFERTLRRLSVLNRVLVGPLGRAIFDAPTLAAQQAFFREQFPRRRFALVTRLLGNASVLNALLYRGAFPARNIEGSAAKFYDALFHRLLFDLPVRESFFLQLLFLGRIEFEEGMPAECEADIFEAAKAGLRNARVELVRGDLVRSLQGLRRVGFVSASDVPSFMPDPAAHAFLQSIRPTLSDGATVVTRGHLRVVSPRLEGFRDITSAHAESLTAERTQLWHVNIYRHLPLRLFSWNTA